MPEGPIAITLNKSSATCYAGDSFTLDSWLSPGDVAQGPFTPSQRAATSSPCPDGLKAEVTALKTGTATIQAAAKNEPGLTKDRVVKVTANNFKTNLQGSEVRSGTWFADDTAYIGSHAVSW